MRTGTRMQNFSEFIEGNLTIWHKPGVGRVELEVRHDGQAHTPC